MATYSLSPTPSTSSGSGSQSESEYGPSRPLKSSRRTSTTSEGRIKRTRNRPHQSCEPCRGRKTKCSRESYCTSCRVHGTKCYWMGASPTAPSQEEEIEALRDEVKRLKFLVKMMSQQAGVGDISEPVDVEAAYSKSTKTKAVSPVSTAASSDGYDEESELTAPSFLNLISGLAPTQEDYLTTPSSTFTTATAPPFSNATTEFSSAFSLGGGINEPIDMTAHNTLDLWNYGASMASAMAGTGGGGTGMYQF